MDAIDKINDHLRNVGEIAFIQIGLILLGAWLLILLAQRLVPLIADRVPTYARYGLLAMVPILRLVIVVTAFILILFRLVEPTIENLLSVFVAFALALGFAVKDYISSLTAGVVTLGETPYRPGDWIEVNGVYGEVKEIGMRTIKILTPDDTAVFIPHLMAWNHLIHNANDGSRYLQCIADFYLHPDHDGTRVRNLLHDVALTSAFLSFDRPILVIAHEKPWGTHYRLKAYPIDPRLQFRFVTDLTERGKAALLENGSRFATYPFRLTPRQPYT
ncbi:mechanosensitive ion channel family protein [Methylohalobius crimeensis]|uniref:mechanosensitive ion channel family protein n=1 Tax=Methylohalobius crimeensis TaxID=244365 RepID=UPI0003B64D76|nr:mechanosensitive ion channel domain-containing protein [Methylohalobius crimeensis]